MPTAPAVASAGRGSIAAPTTPAGRAASLITAGISAALPKMASPATRRPTLASAMKARRNALNRMAQARSTV